ncbi:MAG: alpha/beta hydrolase [Gemmatimonadetes bacterium]|nr:alpha/beta hydrolase [Gemmatimonadota bacterium]
MRGALRTARYVRSWKSGGDVTCEDVEFDRSGITLPATVVKPRAPRAPLAGWIALGGISRMGRQHPQLVRFANALASSGAVVVVPEIPEWRRLEMAPRVVAPTLRGCIDVLRTRKDVASERFGLIGFSFGAPQVAVAAAREDLANHIAGAALFGGYCSLERTMTCALTGEHEWDGVDHRLRPDPFGGWVVGSNYLTQVDGYEDADDVAAALHRLADASSGQRIPAWDPRHDGLIEELRAALPERRRDLFGLFAIPSHETHAEPEQRRRMAMQLAETCRRAEPLLDPADDLARIQMPTRLLHGRGDRLIPFTEGHRLFHGLPESSRRGLTVTGLFHHTADSEPTGVVDHVFEQVKMLGAIRGLINTV